MAAGDSGQRDEQTEQSVQTIIDHTNPELSD